MLKKSISLILLFALITIYLGGCSNTKYKQMVDVDKLNIDEENINYTPKELKSKKEIDQVLTWNLASDPKTLDPGLNTASDGGNIINNTFEGLMREVDGNIKPAMAEKYEVSEDRTVYTFYIREDAKWSDGRSVTANDFEYAWSRVLDNETKSGYLAIFNEANIEKFEAKDKKTFVVHLKAPTPWFLSLTTFYTFFPIRKDIAEAEDDGSWAKDPELAISNGPFTLTEYKKGSHIILKPNKYYWEKEKVKLEKIVVKMILDSSIALTAYENGEIDINPSTGIPSSEIPRLIAEDPTFYIFPMLGTYYYSFNTNIKPLDNPKVRRALSLAIDRNAIVKLVTKGGKIPAQTMIPPPLKDAEGNVFKEKTGDYGIKLNADVETALQLLDEAGYKNGEDFPVLELVYNESDNHENIAKSIKLMWKENLGIDVELVSRKWDSFQSKLRNHNYDIARAGWIADYRDPLNFLGIFKSGLPMNYPDWKNEEYDKLLEKSMTKKDQERFELLYKADRLLMNSSIVAPIYYYTDINQISNDVEGWELNAKNTWFFGHAEMVN